MNPKRIIDRCALKDIYEDKFFQSDCREQILMAQVNIQKPIPVFKFICLTCSKEFDQDAHSPYIICSNQRTLCKTCLQNILKEHPEDEETSTLKSKKPFERSSVKKFEHLASLKVKLTESAQINEEKIKGENEGGEGSEQGEKTAWLLAYVGELGCRYNELAERERQKQAETTRKIEKYQNSLERLSKQFWRVRGDHEFEHENCQKMIDFAQHIIKNSPNHNYGGVGLGSQEEQIGLFEVDPVQWYCKGRAENSLTSSPYDLLGLAYLISGEHSEAEKWYSARLAKNHDNYQLLLGLANTEYNLGKYTEAEQLYKRVIELKPSLDRPYQQIAFIYWLKKKDVQEGRKWAKLTLQKNATNIYAEYILAITDQGEGKLDSLLKLVEKNKAYARAYNGLGKVYKQNKEYEEAIKWYKKAIEINPKYEAPYYGLGVVYYTRGEYDEAIRWFEECLRINSKYQSPLCGLGSAYHKKNNTEQSLKWYGKCLEVDPNHFQALNGMATVQALKANYDQAAKQFNHCLQLEPKHCLSWNSLGNVYLEKGDFDNAIQCYLKCIEIDPKYGAPYNGLSNVYVKKGDEEEAKKWYNKKVEALK